MNAIEEKMQASDYHEFDAISSSAMKEALISPAHYKSYLEEPREPTDAMEIGTIIHSAILEQDYSKYLKGPCDDKRLKAWKEFEAANENSDKILLKPKDHATIKKMFEVFFNHPVAGKIVTGGKPEVSFFAEDEKTGLKIKGRIDYLVQNSNGNFLVDYKSTRCARASEFRKEIFNYRYDLSLAHYKDMAEKAYNIKIDDVFLAAQEKTGPCALKIYRLSDSALLQGLNDRDKALYTIKQAKDLGKWHAYSEAIEDIDMAPWAYSELNGVV